MATKITKEVKIRNWSLYSKNFKDEEGTIYRWHSNSRGHSWHYLRIGRVERELLSEYGLLMSCNIVTKYQDYAEVSYVKLSYTQDFITKNLDKILRDSRGNLDGSRVNSLLTVQKIPESLCAPLISLVTTEANGYTSSVIRSISRTQKFSKEFIIDNLDWLDIRYLKLSHLSSEAQFRIKMMRELI